MVNENIPQAIIPSEGMWLTQRGELRENEVRIFSESVYCPQGQEDNWHEVSDEYKQEWEQSHANDEPL